MEKKGIISSLQALLLMSVAIGMSACSDIEGFDDMTDSTAGEDVSVVVRADLVPQNGKTTRAKRATKIDLTTFSLYAINGKTVAWNNIFFERDVNTGICVPSKPTPWPAGATLAICGVYPSSSNVSSIKMNVASGRNFTYTVPQKAEDQVDLMICGRPAVKEDMLTDNVLIVGFDHALALVQYQAKLMIKDAIVYIKDVTVHNMQSSGVFTFGDDPNKENTGVWASPKRLAYKTITETYDTVKAKLDTYGSTIALTRPAQDTAVMYIPQKSTKWTTTKRKAVPLTTADANKNAYLSITAKIYDTKLGKWIMGYQDSSLENDPDPDKQRPEWRTSYFVLPAQTWTMGKVHTVLISYDAGFDEDGIPWFPTHQEKDIPVDYVPEFLPEQNLDFNVVITEQWEEDNTNSATIVF